jgi:hypothetical protein
MAINTGLGCDAVSVVGEGAAPLLLVVNENFFGDSCERLCEEPLAPNNDNAE